MCGAGEGALRIGHPMRTPHCAENMRLLVPKNTEGARHLAPQHTSLVVRLVFDRQGQLQRGALVDLQGAVVGRFLQLAELPGLIEQFLAQQIDSLSQPRD